MDGHYLYNLASFYIATFIITAIFCISARDDDDFIKGVFLGILFFANQWDPTWTDPRNMFVYHTSIILLMAFGFQNVKHWGAFLVITFILFLSDVYWMSMLDVPTDPETWNFPHDIFYWQSILSISIFVLCLITIKGCRDTLLARKLERRKRALEGKDVDISESQIPDSIGGKAIP